MKAFESLCYRCVDILTVDTTVVVAGYTDIVSLLLKDERVDPGALGYKALKSASQYGHAPIVTLLLAHPSVDPSAEVLRSALKLATQARCSHVVALLQPYSA